MNVTERRDYIKEILTNAKTPIKGDELAKQLKVSRQIVVQDIALLRAIGMNIIATPQGYISYNIKKEVAKIKSKNHKDIKEFYEELKSIVDLGGKIKDVIVDHPLYGEIKVELNISSKRDIDEFIKKASNDEFKQLSSLTKENHIHTIEAESKEILEEIISDLSQKNILYEDNPLEK